MALRFENDLFAQKGSLADYDVLFLGFVNKRGRLESSSSRVRFDLSEQKLVMLVMEASLQDRMLRDFNEDFGEVSYSVIERKSIKFVSIPLDSGILLGVLPRISDHRSFVNAIKTILHDEKNHKKQVEVLAVL